MYNGKQETDRQGEVYDRHIEQLRRDFNLALALAEQRDRLNVETDKAVELQRLASLVEEMRKEIRDAQERIKDSKCDRDLINAFENRSGWKFQLV